MDALTLARWQFALTTIYHFFFVPLTLGLSILVAIMETLYVSTGQDVYKRMTKFWGKLFLINFAMGVVTGIVQEFQFGMNWSEYSRFVGDIFGVPLAIEALLAFFLESTFLGIWIFGWDRLSPKLHAATIWLVALGANISSLWILIANSFMQQPVGYALQNDRAEMVNFFQLLFNPNIFTQFPHTILAGFTTGAFFVMGISIYHLARKNETDFFKRSLKIAAIFAIISTVLVGVVGHVQGQHMVKNQPMKMAAAEALWESEDPAALSLFSVIDATQRRNIFSIRIPRMLSFLSYNSFSGEVKGINELQSAYQAQYGPGDYTPPVFLAFWTFRIMVGIGLLLILLALYALFLMRGDLFKSWPLVLKILPVKQDPFERPNILIRLFPLAILLPYLSNTCGWLLTETGRYPWIVFGLIKIQEGISPNVTIGMLWISLLGYILVYSLLIITTIYLFLKFAKAGPSSLEMTPMPEETPSLIGIQ